MPDEEDTLPVLSLFLVTAGGRRICARRTTAGSRLREAGVHFGFATCSHTCVAALRAALDEEQRVGELQWLTGPTSGTA